MTAQITRRSLMAAGAAALALGSTQARFAQAKPKMRFSCAFPETDLRAEGYKAFAAAMKDDLDFEPYWSNTLFKQGTELVALQRENLELCNLAPADISKQIPAWSLMTSAYLFRDYDHLNKTFEERRRPGIHQDGARPARHRADPPGVLRRASGQPEAEQEDQHAGRSRGHQAAHAAGRVLAVPRRVARRKSDAGRLRGALHRAAGRRGRRAGQSARLRPLDEVLRSDLAVHPHQPRARLRHAGGVEEGVVDA